MIGISPEKVCFIIAKAREFDVKVEPVIPDDGSNPADMDQAEILNDAADDPTAEELRGAISSLNEEERNSLIALCWIGRGDFGKDEWDDAVAAVADLEEARQPRYLLGIPLLGDYLEEGLSEMGYSCEEFEIDRL